MTGHEGDAAARGAIVARRDDIARRHGPWTAHNIHLGHGVYTLGERVAGTEPRTRRIVQAVADTLAARHAAPREPADAPLSGLRVLDLGCLEGQFALEFALAGAEVVGIEGRGDNIAKARFAAAELGLERVTFRQEDVRTLDPATHGAFDVVLCLGLLYHLDAPDALRFVQQLAAVCRRLLVLDTHVSPTRKVTVPYGGATYAGRRVVEHREASTGAQRLELRWASLDNPRSFWPTRESLLNLVTRSGFSTVTQVLTPTLPNPADRVLLLALKGEPQRLRTTPLAADVAFQEWPEPYHPERSRQLHATYRLRFLFSELVRALPGPLKRAARALIGR